MPSILPMGLRKVVILAGMHEKPAGRRQKSWVGPATAIAVLLVVLTLYVLSYGPAFVAMHQGKLSADVFNVAYYPIIWLGRRSKLVNGILYWYILMWGFSPD